MDAELSRMGLQAEYVHASPPDRSFTMSNMRRNSRVEFGIACSHVKAILTAFADGVESALILEDDVRFLCDRKRLNEVVGELPTSWDVCYFGGHPRGPTTRATVSLVKVSTFSFAEAYLLSRKAIMPLMAYWLDRAGKPDAMIDLVLGEFAARNNGYCAYPLLTEQRQVVSHVSGKVDQKAHLLTKGWANHGC
jgi:GR25 family glycosyltransferase involved in LPS biosynthesis